MLELFLTLLIIAIILVLSELLLREKIIHGEIARKFVHILTGVFISSWAFYLEIEQIQAISLLLIIGVLISQRLKIFKAIRNVDRNSWGEILFAVSVGVTATLAPSSWVYTIAILNMSLADGLAAVVGSAYGGSTKYKVFGYKKTLVGSGVFYLTSFSIMLLWILFGIGQWQYYYIFLLFWVPLLSSLSENIAVNGLDNLVVPIVVIATFEIFTKIYA